MLLAPAARSARPSWARRALVLGVATALLPLAGCTAESGVSRAAPANGPARALYDNAWATLQNKPTAYCSEIAAAIQQCKDLIASGSSSEQKPEKKPTIIGVTTYDRSGVTALHLRWSDGQGDRTGDFAVLREQDGQLRALTPIFWSGVKYSDLPSNVTSVTVKPSSTRSSTH